MTTNTYPRVTIEIMDDLMGAMDEDGEILDIHELRSNREAKRQLRRWQDEYTFVYAEALKAVSEFFAAGGGAHDQTPEDDLETKARALQRAAEERNARAHIEHVAKALEVAATSVRRYVETFDGMETRRKKADVLGWVVNHMMTSVLNNCRLDLLVDDAAKLAAGNE